MEEIITESTPTESNDSGFNEFMQSFDGNHTEEVSENTNTENVSENSAPDESGSPQAEDAEASDTTEEEKEVQAEENAEPQETFTIKVNKEEKQLTREEMTAAAQKGMDYDRVKGQRDQLQAELEAVKAQASEHGKYDPVINQLEAISKTTNKPLEEVAMSLRKAVKRQSGMSDAEIEATIRAEDAEFAVQAMKAQAEAPQTDERSERMTRDLEEFRAVYPDVDLTEELVSELSEDVKGGMGLTNAYSKNQIAKKDAEIAKLNAEIKKLNIKVKGEEQNRKNARSTLGSMSDDGGAQKLTGFDEFMSHFGGK